jgi:hypothetical protein
MLILVLNLMALTAIFLKLRELNSRQPRRVVLIEGIERAEKEQEMEFAIDLTAGGKKLERMKPLNKFGLLSQWDADNPVHVVTSDGLATFEPTDVNFAGEPFPADQAGQWFILRSNGATGITVAEFEGDGHTEKDGEPEVIELVKFTVTVNATSADVKTVAIEESEEISE